MEEKIYKVIIHMQENKTFDYRVFEYEGEKGKERIINEIFERKIYACHFANTFIAINTEKILFVEIQEGGSNV